MSLFVSETWAAPLPVLSVDLLTESSLCGLCLASCVLSLVDPSLAHSEAGMWGMHFDVSSRRKGLPTSSCPGGRRQLRCTTLAVLRTSKQEVGDWEGVPLSRQRRSEHIRPSMYIPRRAEYLYMQVQCGHCSDEYAIRTRLSSNSGDAL